VYKATFPIVLCNILSYLMEKWTLQT